MNLAMCHFLIMLINLTRKVFLICGFIFSKLCYTLIFVIWDISFQLNEMLQVTKSLKRNIVHTLCTCMSGEHIY